MTLAWKYWKMQAFESWPICLKAAWKVAKIKDGLGIEFSYTKQTGELRFAWSVPVPTSYQYSDKQVSEGPANIVKYYDGYVGAWRSFDIKRLSV